MPQDSNDGTGALGVWQMLSISSVSTLEWQASGAP